MMKFHQMKIAQEMDRAQLSHHLELLIYSQGRLQYVLYN